MILCQLPGIPELKIRRNESAFYAALAQKMREHFLIRRRLFRFTLHFPLELIERNKLVDLCRPATTIHLQITQNDCALPVLLEKNEWIASPKLGGVKHVGIDVDRRNDQSCTIFSCLHDLVNCRATASVAK